MSDFCSIYDLALLLSVISGYTVYRCDKSLQSALVITSSLILLGCSELLSVTIYLSVFFAIHAFIYSKELSQKYNSEWIKLILSLVYTSIFIGFLIGIIVVDWSNDPELLLTWIKTESGIIWSLTKDYYLYLLAKI